MQFFGSEADVKNLYKFLLPEKKLIMKFSVALLFSSAGALSFPLALDELYSLCHTGSSAYEIGKATVKWSLFLSISSIATFYRKLSIEQLSNKLSLSLRRNYFEVLLHKKILLYEQQNSGYLSHQLGQEISHVSYKLISELSACMRGVALLTGGIGFLLYTSIPLTLVTILPITSLALVSRYYGNIIKLQRQRSAESARFNHSYIRERLEQIKIVKLFNAESFEINKYDELLKNFNDKAIDVAKTSAKHQGFIEAISQNTLLWCVGYGAYLISINSGLSIGKLTAFGMYSMHIGLGFRLLATGYTELQKVSGIFRQIHRNTSEFAMESITLIPNKLIKHTIPINKTPYIEFQDVSFRYPNTLTSALNGISFKINYGEIVGIIGQSGSGKSSIFNMLTNLYDPLSGKVLIDGVNIFERSVWWPRQLISIVAQEALLFSGNIFENIQYSNPDSSESDVIEACKKADAYGFIMELPEKLLTQVGEKGHALSGGQRQRILIARALLKKPHIYLFDEATSALDASSEGYFQSIIENELKGKGTTVIIISHRVKSLKNITDKLILIDEGKVIAIDTFDNLTKHPEFQLLL